MEDPQRQLLSERVLAIKQAHIKYVKIAEDLRQQIDQHFFEARAI
jgi:hypothetical protein